MDWDSYSPEKLGPKTGPRYHFKRMQVNCPILLHGSYLLLLHTSNTEFEIISKQEGNSLSDLRRMDMLNDADNYIIISTYVKVSHISHSESYESS